MEKWNKSHIPERRRSAGKRSVLPENFRKDSFNNLLNFRIPADIVFTIRDKPHKYFKREGSDIRFMAKLTLKQALLGVVFEITTLSGEKIRISTKHEIITPTSVKRIPNYGLPYPKDTSRRGDLLVAFDIQFPKTLNFEQKEMLSKLPDT